MSAWGDTPETWVHAFREEVRIAQGGTGRRWVALLNSLAMMGAGDPEDPYHPCHGDASAYSPLEYNAAVVAALAPVRSQVRAALRREVTGPDQWIEYLEPLERAGPYGRIMLKDHARWLLGVV